MQTTTWTLYALVGGFLVGLTLFVMGGIRFRQWVVSDRVGIPRFPKHVETILLWMVYSGAVSFTIIVVQQTLRHI